MTRRRARGKRRGAAHSPTAHEWLGGRFTAPFFVYDRPDPYRPGLALWFELPDGLIVGQDVFLPEEAEGAVARALRDALTQPTVGRPRRPEAIRVADAAVAEEVRGVIPKDIPVTIAPTPELDEICEHLMDAMSEAGDVEASYLEGGRIPAAAVEALFAASSELFTLQPWKLSDEPPALRMDIPSLGIDGACVAIIGQQGNHRGVLVFRSYDDFEAFADIAEPSRFGDAPVRPGAELLALTFESANELPRSMRREAMENGWRVKSADAYPLVDRRTLDGEALPVSERDVEIATACALSLAAFIGRHAAILKAKTSTPVCESYFDNNDHEVRITVPHESLADFDLTDPVEFGPRDDFEPAPADGPFRPRAGRNEPCPCGSGRKYKKCHLAADEARHAGSRRAIATHRMDGRLVDRLMEFAALEFGAAWRRFGDHFVDVQRTAELARPWSVYDFEVDGKTVVDAYLEVHERRCSREERRWLDAQRAAWLSVWEVEAVDPGRSLTLRDLLSDERRIVLETSASKLLVPRDALLGRVVDHDGVSVLCGSHLHPLPPLDAAKVIHRARRRLRRKRAVPVERLRPVAFGRNLIRYWEETAETLDMRSSMPSNLQNTDGESLLLTVDRFEVAPGAMADVAARVAALKGVHREEAGKDSATYVFLRPKDPAQPGGEATLIGLLRLDPSALRIETNSRARADALRERVEAACGTRIRHRARDHTDPLALVEHQGKPSLEPTTASADAEKLAAEFKARHYAEWPDIPVPALMDRTPRECARTAAGRRQVDLLIKHMENMEQRAAGGAAFDFSTLRSELGLGVAQKRPAQAAAQHSSGVNKP